MTDAAICIANNWRVGDILEGEEHGSISRIKITTIGEIGLLTREIWRNGELLDRREGNWTLSCRNWKLVKRSGTWWQRLLRLN